MSKLSVDSFYLRDTKSQHHVYYLLKEMSAARMGATHRVNITRRRIIVETLLNIF
jgi:hypothetical protein